MSKMTSRQRFLASLSRQPTDRPPLFKEGIRDEVLEAWRGQGLPEGKALEDLFVYDDFEELIPDLYPIPEFTRWSATTKHLDHLRHRLDPADPRRLPENWEQQVRLGRERTHALLLRVHIGYFLTLGVDDWRHFSQAVTLLKDDPAFVHALLGIQANFAAELAQRILSQVQVDGVIFSEPIASSHGPLISPKMYADFMLRSFEPLLDVIEQHQVPVIILRSYANFRALLPVVLQRRLNCLWACECNPEAMDYRQIRKEFGPRLGLIGGIDGDVLRYDKQAIRQEIEEKVVPLLSQGGYIPLADGRVRDDVPFENYAYYRRMLEATVSAP